MNWMTSGRHRALYSQRGRRRQMHFPSQTQRQRVKATSPPHSSQPARERNSATPWYILPVGDDDESQDIRVLELERKGAMTAVAEEYGQTDLGSDGGAVGGVKLSPKRKRSDGYQEQDVQEGRREMRCIFTPIKKAREYDQLPERAKTVREERPPSSIASDVDVLFFNDGQELPHKNRAQRVNQVSAEPIPLEASDQRFSQQNGHQEAQQNYQGDDLQSHESDAQHLFPDHHAFPDNTGQDQRSFQLWRINSNSCVGSRPDAALGRPESASCKSANHPFRSTPPSSPFEASPLSFRMSRTEVLQSQISTKVHDPLGTRMSFTPSPHGSPSSSTSTSSQGSIVLGRPPLGWQNKLLLSLKEDTAQKTKDRVDNLGGDLNPSSPTNFVDNNPETHDPNNSREFLLELSSSPRSSAGSDGDNSISDTIVPIDAKERIMAAATSQHHPEDSQTWFQRQSTTECRDTKGANTVFSEKSSMAFQQSWVMSSRTQAVLGAVSSSKASSGQDAIQKHTTKHQEMESVAIYMYTLVQCYKIDEKLRFVLQAFFTTPLELMLLYYSADGYYPRIAEHSQLISTATSPAPISALTNQTPCRREIIFSPKRAN